MLPAYGGQRLRILQQAINLSPNQYQDMAKTDSDFDNICSDEQF
ncbi:MAG: hypothetical protein V7K38_02725 [Nostoc sp.]